jgi:hypothetical protein
MGLHWPWRCSAGPRRRRSRARRQRPALRINWNPFTETWKNLKLAHGNLVVFRSLLGIPGCGSSARVPVAVPAFAKEVLHGNEQVASLLLVVFSIGIGIGSLLCEVLSRRHVEIGLVPLGAIGMKRVLDRPLLRHARTRAGERAHARCLHGTAGALARHGPTGAAVAVYRALQRADVRADPAALGAEPPGAHHRREQHLERAVLIASSVAVGLLLKAGFTIPQVFLAVGISTPSSRATSSCWCRNTSALRRLRRDAARLPSFPGPGRRAHPGGEAGGRILVCTMSASSSVLLMAAEPGDPIYFIMDHRIFQTPVLGWFFAWR